MTGAKPVESIEPVDQSKTGNRQARIAKPEIAKPIETAKPLEPGVKAILPGLIPGLIPKILPSLLPGVAAINPLIGLAAAVLPDILKAVVGDKAGTVAGAVTQAVTQITQTQNPEEARNKLAADPAAVAALQLKLAEIAAAQEDNVSRLSSHC